MKIKKLKKRNLRQLTGKEFKNPLLPLVELCCSETSLDYLVEDTHRFIRATSCEVSGFTASDFGEMLFFYERFLKHIELLYLFMSCYPDWRVSKDSPFYDIPVSTGRRTIYDADMFGGTYLKFHKLAENEFWDLRVFMESFFTFKPLREWRHTLDDMLYHVFSDETFPQYHTDAFQTFAYLDKLSEAMFLAYLIHGKPYMLSHCAEHFGNNKKKLADTVPEKTDNDLSR